MSDIHFSADLDSKKLEAAIKSSNQTIGEWSKGVEKSGGQVDKVFEKNAKSFKDSIKEQKLLIKEIEADVKKLQKAFEDAAPGRGSQAVGRDLIAAKKALAEEQGTLLGLQKQQIESNTKEAASTEGIIGKLKGWALGLVTVGAALKIGKAIIASTEESAHKFEVVLAEASAGVGYFFKSIASGDWTNFFEGLGKAIRGAKEFVDQMEILNNKRNELNIKSSALDIKIGEERSNSYSAEPKVVKEALTNIIALQKEKFDAISDLSKKEYQLNLEKASTDSGLAKEKIENFISEYSSLDKLLEKGKEYNEITKLTRKSGIDPKYLQTLLKERDALGNNATEAGKFVTQISKVTPEARKILSDFLATQNKDLAAFNLNNRRDKQRLVGIEKQEQEDKKSAAKKAIEDAKEAAKIENKIAKEKEQLNKAIDAGDDVQMKAIAARIKLLQDELTEREKIARLIVEQSGYEGFVPTKVGTSGLKIPSLYIDPKTGKKPALSGLREINKSLVSEGKEGDRIAKEEGKDREDSLKRQKELKQDILKGAIDLTYQMGVQLGLDEDELNVLGQQLDLIGSLASSDYVGAAVNVLSQLITLIPSSAETFATEIENINRLIEEQNRLIEASARIGGGELERQKAITLLEEQRNTQAERLAHIQTYGGGVLWTMNKTKKEIDKLTQAVEDSDYAILQANQDLDDFLTGGITQNALADVIAQGFQEGKTSVDDFGEYMNQVLLDAVMTVFKQQFLLPMIDKELMPVITAALGDNILSDEEKKNIDNITASIAEKNKVTWEGLTGALDLGGSTSNNGLSGGIQRSITESTGSEIVGIMRRIADDVRGNRDYNLLGITHLVGIERNTLDTVSRLDLAITELQSINKNTKQVNVGVQ